MILRRCRRCSLRFWCYRRPLVSVVCLATIIVSVQILLMSILNSDSKDSIVHQGRNNKVAKVALIKAKPKIPSEGLGRILGVVDELQDKYLPDEDGNFKCLFSTQTIAFDRLNDDYCDCTDGTDEPSTSACVHAYFVCSSGGTRIPSSRVNDGVCDCCDGSDEYRRESVIRPIDDQMQEKIGHHISPCKNTCNS